MALSSDFLLHAADDEEGRRKEEKAAFHCLGADLRIREKAETVPPSSNNHPIGREKKL